MQPGTPAATRAQEQAGWAALTDWAGLPTFGESVERGFSTHERPGDPGLALVDPGNKDFNSFLAVCGERPATIAQHNDASVECGPGQEGYLIAADDGPGYVSRILLARGFSSPSSSVLTDLQPISERVRIFIDANPTPVFDRLWKDWAMGGTAPFLAPLTSWTSGGLTSYLPVSYTKQLRVFIDELDTTSSSLMLYYAQVDTHRVSATQPYDASTLSAPDARAELDALLKGQGSRGEVWFDNQVVLEGSGAWTAWTHDRPGTLERLELQLDPATASEVMNETVLRLSWDDGAPTIDLSLAMLFGARHGFTPLSTLPLSAENDGAAVKLTLSLPMPFARSARMELVHASDNKRSLHVRIEGNDRLPRGQWGRLRATLYERSNPQDGERFRVVALSGRGKYLGSLLYARGKADSSRSVRADELGFLEGDERLEIDGEVAAVGTGTDNYFNGGFYFKTGTFNSPFAAVSQLTTDTANGTSEATLVRWTILGDDRQFQRQLELSMEFGADRPATVRDYAAVSFYYQ